MPSQGCREWFSGWNLLLAFRGKWGLWEAEDGHNMTPLVREVGQRVSVRVEKAPSRALTMLGRMNVQAFSMSDTSTGVVLQIELCSPKGLPQAPVLLLLLSC